MAPNQRSDVRISMRGQMLTDWVEYDIESNMLQTSDAFSFTVANPRGRWTNEFDVLDEVQVFVDGSLQMTGYVDEISTGIDPNTGPTMTIVGRDRFGQLADISSKPKQFANKHLADIAYELGVPFVEDWIYDNELNRKRAQVARKRISAVAAKTAAEKRTIARKKTIISALDRDLQGSTDSVIESQRVATLNALGKLNQQELASSTSGAANIAKAKANLARIQKENFPRVKVEPGDSPLDVICKYAKKAGVMVWQAADGTGILARPNYSQPINGNLWCYDRAHIDHQKNNILSGRVVRSSRDRFRKYRLLGYSANTKNTSGTGSRYDEKLSDSGISLVGRDFVIARASGQSVRQAKAELEREVQRRKFEALVADYTVRGHGQTVRGERSIWTVDTLVNVDDQPNALKQTMYVTRRKFTGGLDGQQTELTLHQPGILMP